MSSTSWSRAPTATAVEPIHARPDGMPVGGLVLHPDMMGVRPLFDDLCRRLATHGFAVCAPEPFARAPMEIRAATESRTRRMASVAQLDDDLQIGDLEAAADYLVVAGRRARGRGHGVLHGRDAGAQGRGLRALRRAVAFYGMIRRARRVARTQHPRPLDTAAEVCPTLAIFGGVDALAPAADIDALRAAWADRPDCEIVVYPEADHGFVHAPERPAHRADDAADAWRRALAFLLPN